MTDFNQKRRQQFLVESVYKPSRVLYETLHQVDLDDYQYFLEQDKIDIAGLVSCKKTIFEQKLYLWMLDYTAGMSLDTLAGRVSEIVDTYVDWYKENLAYNKSRKENPVVIKALGESRAPLDASPVDLFNQISYEATLQLISIAALVRDHRSLARIARCLPHHKNDDDLLANIFEFYFDDIDTEDSGSLINDYQPLLDIVYSKNRDPSELPKILKDYVEKWYTWQDGAKWYEAHKEVDPDDNSSMYCGYWAMEAGLIAFLYHIDDSNIDHMVYPKDLVNYARQLEETEQSTTPIEELEESYTKYRCEAGKKCPKTGDWYSPANPDLTTRHFEEGEIMPDIPDNKWGQVIWYLNDVSE